MTQLGSRLRLTVLGWTTSAPHPAAPTSGFLIEWGSTTVLLDCGQGVVRSLQRYLDPHRLTAVVVGHMHADHYLDVVALRYLFPWGHPASERMALHLPPGGRDRIADLARAISERDGFFDAAFTITEYDPAGSLELDGLRLRFVRGRHYVPAWGIVVDALDGTRVAYSGDTGPSPDVEDGMRDADLLLVESALADAGQDDTERGHLTAEEAVELARRARARSALLVHFAPDRKAELDAVCAAAGPWVRTAVAGLTVTVRRGGPAPV